jgi:hypothetical protein
VGKGWPTKGQMYQPNLDNRPWRHNNRKSILVILVILMIVRRWLLAWRKNVWEVDGQKYAEITRSLDDEYGNVVQFLKEPSNIVWIHAAPFKSSNSSLV